MCPDATNIGIKCVGFEKITEIAANITKSTYAISGSEKLFFVMRFSEKTMRPVKPKNVRYDLSKMKGIL